MRTDVPFFVTGLPRSRSAWLANWLTTDRTLCWHDRPFNARLMRPDRRVGFSGAELLPEFDKLRVACPDAPWLVVLRPHADTLESFVRWAGAWLPTDRRVLEGFWERRCALLAVIQTDPRCFVVCYDSLNEESPARAAWQHLVDLPFDEDRWRLLKGLNVQQQLPEKCQSER